MNEVETIKTLTAISDIRYIIQDIRYERVKDALIPMLDKKSVNKHPYRRRAGWLYTKIIKLFWKFAIEEMIYNFKKVELYKYKQNKIHLQMGYVRFNIHKHPETLIDGGKQYKPIFYTPRKLRKELDGYYICYFKKYKSYRVTINKLKNNGYKWKNYEKPKIYNS